MKPFPYFLVRKAAESQNLLQTYGLDEDIFFSLMTIYEQKKINIVNFKFILSEAILYFLKENKDEEKYSKLLNVRREIYNSKPLSLKYINYTNSLLPENLLSQIQKYQQLQTDLISIKDSFLQWYDRNMLTENILIRNALKNESIQKGMLLSSFPFFQEANKFIDKEIATYNKDDNNVQLTAIKYLTRTCMKTSPFSTFTTVSYGQLANDVECFGLKINSKETEQFKTISHVKLNSGLLKYVSGLLKYNKKIVSRLELKLNPTLHSGKNTYNFLINNNNIESFQELEKNALIKLVVNKLKKGTRIFGILCKDLELHIEMQPAQIVAYLFELQQLGLFDFEFNLSGMDPDWDIAFIRTYLDFQTQELTSLPEFIQTLTVIRSSIDSFEKANSTERASILIEIYKMLSKACYGLQIDAGLLKRTPVLKDIAPDKSKQQSERKNTPLTEEASKEVTRQTPEVFRRFDNLGFYFSPNQIIYEDTTISEVLKINKGKYHALISKIDSLYEKFSLIKGNSAILNEYLAFFNSNYTYQSCIDLLKFYEDYHRNIKINRSSKQTLAQNETADSLKTDVKFKTIWEMACSNIVANTVFKNNCCYIAESFFDGMEEKLTPSNTDNQSYSCAVFAQAYIKDENGSNSIGLVINRFLPGYGKMFSRFLHFLPKEMTNEIRQGNLAFMKKDELFIEITDASFFNANIHPPLMPYELSTHGSQHRLPPENRFAITEFEVVKEESTENLIIRHKTSGKRAFFFDSDFQGHTTRSKLFQMLSNFSTNIPFNTFWLHNICNKFYTVNLNKKSGLSEMILLYPRIIFAEDIIIQRKRWQVPIAEFPDILRQPLHECFLTINEWRLKYGIPNEVFFSISERMYKRTEQNPKLGKDDYKPQYINFCSPVMTRLIVRLLKKCEKFLIIEEMYPESSNMLTFEGKKYATEFVLQWDKN